MRTTISVDDALLDEVSKRVGAEGETMGQAIPGRLRLALVAPVDADW